jgi:hypothetical protein
LGKLPRNSGSPRSAIGGRRGERTPAEKTLYTEHVKNDVERGATQQEPGSTEEDATENQSQISDHVGAGGAGGRHRIPLEEHPAAPQSGGVLKTLAAWAGIIALFGVVFGAGVFYNRVSHLESDLQDTKQDGKAFDTRMAEVAIRLTKVETVVTGLSGTGGEIAAVRNELADLQRKLVDLGTRDSTSEEKLRGIEKRLDAMEAKILRR